MAIEIVTAIYQGIFRHSEQFMTAIKLGREMLEGEGRPPRIVLDLPANEEKEGGDHPEEDEDPIQERDQGKVNGARKGSFNLKVGFLLKE